MAASQIATALPQPAPTASPGAQAPSAPGMHLPSNLPGRVQIVLGFLQGLPLEAGRTYRFGVELDGRSRDEWSASFHVPGVPPGPVFGGPVGPTSIPNFPG